ncbi:hypothetical protein [Streptomyces sp. NPDC005281]|uniref:hypothetical protein n=1 Tax=Streptomyces sp. NPDC005281 TaxID=3155712 RepID=UPI0033AAE3C8
MLHVAAGSTGTVPWWTTIVITLGAIILTSAGNWLIATRQASTQLALRNADLQGVALEARRKEKLEAFSAFVHATDAAWQAANDFLAKFRAGTIGEYRDEARQVTTDLTRAYLDLLIAAENPTRQAAAAYVDALNNHMQRAARGDWKEEETKQPRKLVLDSIRAELEPVT